MSESTTDIEAPAGTASTGRRIDGLDWARGWMLVASVGSNSVFTGLAIMSHAPWASVMPIDLIFPLFVTLAGCGMAFAFRRVVGLRAVARRALVLLLLGLGYNAVTAWTFNPFELRFPGVLQLYAVLTITVALLHLVTRSWAGWFVLTAVVGLGHSVLISFFALRCAADLVTPLCNPSGPVDSLLFGAAHIYRSGAAGHDPEGIIAMVGAMVSAAAGATIGHLLLAHRDRERDNPRRLPVATVPLATLLVAFLLLAVILQHAPDLAGGGPVPVMKRLWTAPFALVIAAGAAVLVWLGTVALPSNRHRRALDDRIWYPIVALGRNSLLVYFGSHLAMSLLSRPIGDGRSLIERFAGVFPSESFAQGAWTLLWISGWVALAMLLHRKAIYLKP